MALSPITIADKAVHGLGLAPIGVLPSHQRCGIRAAIVRAALDAVDGSLVVLHAP